MRSIKEFISLFELLGFASIIMLILAALGFKNPYMMRVAILVGINIIVIIALNLSNGFAGVFSLGHVGFMAIGAYTSSILTLPVATKAFLLPNLPIWLEHIQLGFIPALLIAGFLAALVALFVGFPLMRLTGNYVAVATLGFLVIIHVILINWEQFTRGARTFSGVIQYTTLWWVYIWILITIYVTWRIVHSHYGRAFLAVRDDPLAAQTMGVNVLRSRLLSFIVSAFLTSVSGVLMAHFLTSFSPTTFYFTATFNYIIVLIIGGLGSISGSIIGATFLVLISEFLRNLEEFVHLYGLSQVIFAVILLLIIIFYPNGVMGYREINWFRLLKSGITGGKDHHTKKEVR